MTLADCVSAGRALLGAAGIDASEAAVDAEVLARALLGWDLARYLADARDEAPEGFFGWYQEWLERRASREPVSQIVGGREFWGLEFEVTRDVLTPRPETELLVEAALASLADLPAGRQASPVIIDAGTGSGCVAISLAREVPGAFVVATDISGAALAVARRNARRHGVSGRVAFVRASLLEAVAGPVDLVVSNPPYVPSVAFGILPPEVTSYEPMLALDGGLDGLDVIRALMDQARDRLAPGGWLIFEFGHGQDAAVRSAVSERPWLDLARIREDLQGIPRTAVLRKAR